MKKIIYLFPFIILLLTLISCGEVITPSTPSKQTESSSSQSTNTNVTFNINVLYKSNPYPGNGKLNIVLRGKNGIFSSELKNDGTASIEAPDGEYYAYIDGTLSYAYDPNLSVVNTSNPNCTINLYAKGKTTGGTGVDLYNKAYKIDNLTSINTSSVYYYVAKVKSASDIVYYEFSPKVAGIYKFESVVNMFNNNINPVAITYYSGSTNTAFGETKVDNGGQTYENGYTKNFAFTSSFTERQIGNVQKFGIRAEVKDSSLYPVEIPFKITYLGEAEQTFVNREIIYASELYYERNEDGTYKKDSDGNYITSYKKVTNEEEYHFNTEYLDSDVHNTTFFNKLVLGSTFIGNQNYFYKKRFSLENGVYTLDPNGDYVLNPTLSIPGTGIIQDLYNSPEMKENESARTILDSSKCFLNENDGIWYIKLNNGQTRPLVANLTTSSHYIDSGIIHLEDEGGTPYSAIATNNKTEDGLRIIENWKRFVEAEYTDMCNSEGYCYVTEELRVFLQKLSNNNQYFFDGKGWCEQDNTYADEASQWLFICGYYK